MQMYIYAPSTEQTSVLGFYSSNVQPCKSLSLRVKGAASSRVFISALPRLRQCYEFNLRLISGMTIMRDYTGTVAQLLALPSHSKKVMGSIPTWGAVGSGGQVLPRVNSAQVGYLPGLSVWSLHVLPVFTRGFLQ